MRQGHFRQNTNRVEAFLEHIYDFFSGTQAGDMLSRIFFCVGRELCLGAAAPSGGLGTASAREQSLLPVVPREF